MNNDQKSIQIQHQKKCCEYCLKTEKAQCQYCLRMKESMCCFGLLTKIAKSNLLT